MSTLCGCGHDMERHNDDGSNFMTGSYAGNCRMCGCEGFVTQEKGTVPGGMTRCTKHHYLHISDWGCPHCYKEAFKPGGMVVETQPSGMDEAIETVDDLRHLNTQIDSFQRSLGEILLLSQTDIENGKYEDMHPLNRLDCIEKEARKGLKL